MQTKPRSPHLADLWYAEVEGFPIGATRIDQGRAYFARGSVKSFQGDVGRLQASVQGSRPEPYLVEVEIDPFPPGEWRRIEDWLEDNDWDKSELEQGRISTALSMQLESADLHLIPRRYKELRASCTCPDWMRPCKHVLAVLFAFGLEIEHDPYVLLRIRGAGAAEESPSAPADDSHESLEPLSADSSRFWDSPGDLESLSLRIGLPEESPRRKYLRRLGPLPFWGGSFDLSPLTRPVYDAVRAARLRDNQDSPE